eukprot:CAMPEP_0117573144 /NCGR_PEP_ID=MMETSP0784-20121206/60782_1 /TAXON_ID=39447 /ORGANISM="" /LENGTH=49 /DNA_ID=CAMNT_0005371659 /DNA_START=651 /DNA_END=800 /DNA_ORIENTATION=-
MGPSAPQQPHNCAAADEPSCDSKPDAIAFSLRLQAPSLSESVSRLSKRA